MAAGRTRLCQPGNDRWNSEPHAGQEDQFPLQPPASHRHLCYVSEHLDPRPGSIVEAYADPLLPRAQGTSAAGPIGADRQAPPPRSSPKHYLDLAHGAVVSQEAAGPERELEIHRDPHCRENRLSQHYWLQRRVLAAPPLSDLARAVVSQATPQPSV